MNILTSEEKQAKIAEHFGHRVFRFCGDLDSDGHEPYEDREATANLPAHMRGIDVYVSCRKCDGHRWRSTRVWEGDSRSRECPDYFNSLDACAGMRRSLSEEQRAKYARILQEIVCEDGDDTLTHADIFRVCDAAPEPHCEAFGKTLGLWE